MPLAPGTRLGPYEITAAIGAGGMGEVYRAKDTRLNRDVAIKVSHEQFSERFAREAYAVAALNHPNICTLHDVGPDYLVMEHVEGTPLKGPVPLDEALRVADQILAALDHAHRHGIVHRDLKPANILLTRQGVKLLDFGLAKVQNPVAVGELTMAEALTTSGMLLGTMHYMAPEQLEGKAADERSDIFSFGCVLYELLTGKRPFDGSSPAQLIAAILQSGPAPADPPALNRILQTCLAKNPDDRWQSANELRHTLRWAVEEPPAAMAITSPRRVWMPWVFAGSMAAVALAFAALWLARPAPEAPAFIFTVDAPPGASFNFLITATAVSPDGRFLVFRASSGDLTPALWLRPLDSLAARRLPGTDGADFPFWSPDSRSVAFFAGDRLKRLDVFGGDPVVIAEAVGGREAWGVGGTWNRTGDILFGETRGLIRVAATGGTPEVLIAADAARQERGYGHPQFLPDGRHFIYLVATDNPDAQGIYVSSLDNPGSRVQLVKTRARARYAPPSGSGPGHLLFLRDRVLVAQRFDHRTLRLEGEPTPLAEDIATHAGLYGAAFWPSENGLLIYRSGAALERVRLIWIRRDGTPDGVAAAEDAFTTFQLSPDGRRVALSRLDAEGPGDIWVLELASGRTTRITLDPHVDGCPAWSRDGRQLAFSSDRTGVRQLYRKDATGAGEEEILTDGPAAKCVRDWSPDGRQLLYTELQESWDLRLLPLNGTRKPLPVAQTRFDETDGQFSPDGKWLAYTSSESGRREVYVTAFDGSRGETRGKWPVSNNGGRAPRWRGDSRELFYLDAENGAMMAVSIEVTGAGIETGTPRRLFAASMPRASGDTPFSYDVTADGQRFLIQQPTAVQSSPLTVVLNWQARLRQQ